MNPFDLPGPAFLGFYVILIIAGFASLYIGIRMAEEGLPPVLPLSDPYKIAWLRGGNGEVARMVALSLIDRGLVELAGTTLMAKDRKPGKSTHLLERAILSRCETMPVEVTKLASDGAIESICGQYRTELDRLHLTADETARAYRWRLYVIVAAVLVGVAVVKITIALDRGHTNIGFLVILAVAAPLVALRFVRRRRTRLGDRMLADLRRLFARLHNRASRIRRGQMTNDVMLLAAVFGFTALPGVVYSDLQRAYARTDSSDSSSGSSCGSSGGGSGCGGGGGCGGCGSS